MVPPLRQIWSGSLKTRLSFALLLPFLTAGVLIALVAALVIQRDMRVEIEREQSSKATLLARSLENQFADRLGVLNTLAAQAAARLPAGSRELDLWLAGQEAAAKAFNRGVFITDAAGIAQASWPASAQRLGLNYSDRDYVRAALDQGQTSVGKPVIGRPLGTPVLLIGTPIRGPDQAIIGVLVGVTDLGRASFLDTLFEHDDTASIRAQYHLIDPKFRMVVASTERERAMEVLPEPAANAGWQSILEGHAGTVALLDQGQTVLASARPVTSLGWMLVLTVPAQDALAWTVDSRNRILAVAGVMALVSLLLAQWFLARQLRPLESATAVLRRQLVSGEPASPLPVANPDEIGALIGSFNRLLKSLKDREENLRIKDFALQSISQGILITGIDRRIISANPSFSQITGYSLDDVLGRDCKLLQGAQTNPNTVQLIRDALAQGTVFTGEILNYRKNGEAFWNELTIAPVRDEAGVIVNFIGVTRDITERHRSEELRRISATAFESQEGIFVTDAQQRILRVNKSFTTITGYTEAEALGRTPRLLSSGRHDAAFYDEMKQSLQQFGYWQGEIWNRRKSGELFPESLTITAVRNEDGEATHYVANFIDIGARKDAETMIHRLAYFDPLTGLPNRRQLEETLRHSLSDAVRTRRLGALLFLDIDNFKLLNDTRGHLVGDALLTQVAQRLRAVVREADTVARLGGDEFVVLLVGLDGDPRVAEVEAEAVGQKLLEVFQKPFLLDSGEFACTSSIGITLFGERVESLEGPLKRADLAMYQAKSAGRNALRFFDETVEAAVAIRVSMEDRLRQAIRNHELSLHFQPQVDAQGRVRGAEALLRWSDPTAGSIPPNTFIPLAEQTGLILQIGRWVLGEACATLARWRGNPVLSQLTLSINVSARQLQSADFAQQVLDAMAQHQIDGRQLKLEITETMLLDQAEDTIAKMNRLQQAGVRFSLDDFGTGYSSLTYLKRLPVEELKIDQSFVRDILIDSNDAAIARLVLAMAQTLGMSVMAEGVEQEAQLAFLKAEGCQGFQGYLFSRPVPLEPFESWVTGRPV